MEVPERLKSFYNRFSDEEIQVVKNNYYYSITEKLNEWKIKFENNLITDDEIVKFNKLLMDDILRCMKDYETQEWANRSNENLLQNDIRGLIRVFLFFDYWELYEKYVKAENEDKITEITEPLTSTQKDKIGLFVRSGIIQFLREKNPNMTNSDISKFIIELVSCEKMTNPESIRPHLITDISNDKHPFYKVGKKEKYDLILHKYGIKPQADQ